jgi:hypothetical protein
VDGILRQVFLKDKGFEGGPCYALLFERTLSIPSPVVQHIFKRGLGEEPKRLLFSGLSVHGLLLGPSQKAAEFFLGYSVARFMGWGRLLRYRGWLAHF